MTQAEKSLEALVRSRVFEALALLELHAAEIIRGTNAPVKLHEMQSTITRVTSGRTTIAVPLQLPEGCSNEGRRQAIKQVFDHCEKVGYVPDSFIMVGDDALVFQINVPAGSYGRD